jgi:hypothetical protein
MTTFIPPKLWELQLEGNNMMSREEIIARTKTVFNAAADYFDAPALSFWNRYGQKTVDQLSLQPGDRVLDVCCGSGASAIPAAIAVGPTGQVIGSAIGHQLHPLNLGGRQPESVMDCRSVASLVRPVSINLVFSKVVLIAI